MTFSLSILVALVISGASLHAQPDSTQIDSVARVKKSPTGAMARSLAIPGWGQFYNGKKVKGTIVATAEVASVVAFFVRRNQINDEAVPLGQPPRRNFYLLSTIGLVFYSVVDAFVDAHLDDFDWGQLEYRPDQRSVTLKLQRKF